MIYAYYYIYECGSVLDMEELKMETKKDLMNLLVEYSNQENNNEDSEAVKRRICECRGGKRA